MSKELEKLRNEINDVLCIDIKNWSKQYDLIKKDLDVLEQALQELELHRKLFKQLNLQSELGIDFVGIPRTYEFYEIVSEDGMYINNEETIETIKQIEKLVGDEDE
jgi:hypothetical protein